MRKRISSGPIQRYETGVREDVLEGFYGESSLQDQGVSRLDQEQALNVARQYIRLLRELRYTVVKAYLFGSYSRGTPSKDSDIDIAVVIDNFDNEFEEQLTLMKHRRAVDLRIEPHPYRERDFDPEDPFVNRIISSGVRIA